MSSASAVPLGPLQHGNAALIATVLHTGQPPSEAAMTRTAAHINSRARTEVPASKVMHGDGAPPATTLHAAAPHSPLLQHWALYWMCTQQACSTTTSSTVRYSQQLTLLVAAVHFEGGDVGLQGAGVLWPGIACAYGRVRLEVLEVRPGWTVCLVIVDGHACTDGGTAKGEPRESYGVKGGWTHGSTGATM